MSADQVAIKIISSQSTSRTRLARSRFLSISGLMSALPGGVSSAKYQDEEGEWCDLQTDSDASEALFLYEKYAWSCLKLQVTEQPGRKNPLSQALLREIQAQHQTVAEQTIDWFLRKMPEAYFRELDSDTRMGHLRSLIALKMAGQKLEIVVGNRNTQTFIKPQNYVGLLAEMIDALPKDRRVREAMIYTAMDGDLVIDVFEFADHDHARKLLSGSVHRERAEYLQAKNSIHEDPLFQQYLTCCDEAYVLNVAASEIIQHFQLVGKCSVGDGIIATLENVKDEPSDDEFNQVFSMEDQVTTQNDHTKPSRLVVVLKSDHEEYAFRRIVKHMSQLGLDIQKATLNRVDNFSDGCFIILTFFIAQPGDVKSIEPDSVLAKKLYDNIRRVPYIEKNVVKRMDRFLKIFTERFSLLEVEVISAWSRLAHCLLAHDRPLVFALYHLDQFLDMYPDVLRSLLRLWDLKLAPLSKSSLSSRYPVVAETTAQLHILMESRVDSEDCRVFYLTMLAIITNTLKTNVHLPDRMCLVLRIDPSILRDKEILRHDKSVHDIPQAIFFVYGRELTAFYIRYRDIARGGLRLLVSNSMEQYSVMCGSLLFECLNLAKTMEIKNKDIPEGGAKAIILQDFRKSSANTPSHGAVKAFIDGILDMACGKRNESSVNLMVDYAGGEELVYLGPDDNISPTMIESAYRRAVYRTHPYPGSFITSKLSAGISHEEYAVISEGASVFLEVFLRHLGVDWVHGDGFSLKLMGSPANAETAGLIRVLCRDFGGRMRVIAIADDSGIAEDPNGLSHTELLRLTTAALPIVEYRQEHLSPAGTLVAIQEGSSAGIKARNAMPFRTESTVFIATMNRNGFINEGNWKQFFDQSGNPASKIILEFDGRFISQPARQHLSKHGVLILKDSSVTKCGVISSSYEILAGMMLSEKEFIDFKKTFVDDVLGRLRHLAALEARIILKEYQNQSSGNNSKHDRLLSLPEVSIAVSKAIIKIKDAISRSRQLSVYIQPIPSATSVVDDDQRRSGFFIESPPSDSSPTTATPHQMDNFRAQAQQAGFTYQSVFHELCRELLLEYLPPTLRSFAIKPPTAADGTPVRKDQIRIDAILSPEYKKRILATALACKIVYNEGIGFLDSTLGVDVHGDIGQHTLRGVTDAYFEKITEYSFRYLVEFERTSDLISRISKARELDSRVKSHLIQVLERGGTRIGIEISNLQI